ncbi:MAG: aconitase X, partial [Desulfurococcales archaeon]|nr:aconitase X [Desulfurococcales archaeon]
WLIIPPDYEKDPFIKNLLDKLREKGIIVLKGICPVISPLNEIGYKCIGTISSKAFFYMPRLAKVKISLMDLPTIISKAF